MSRIFVDNYRMKKVLMKSHRYEVFELIRLIPSKTDTFVKL